MIVINIDDDVWIIGNVTGICQSTNCGIFIENNRTQIGIGATRVESRAQVQPAGPPPIIATSTSTTSIRKAVVDVVDDNVDLDDNLEAATA